MISIILIFCCYFMSSLLFFRSFVMILIFNKSNLRRWALMISNSTRYAIRISPSHEMRGGELFQPQTFLQGCITIIWSSECIASFSSKEYKAHLLAVSAALNWHTRADCRHLWHETYMVMESLHTIVSASKNFRWVRLVYVSDFITSFCQNSPV